MIKFLIGAVTLVVNPTALNQTKIQFPCPIAGTEQVLVDNKSAQYSLSESDQNFIFKGRSNADLVGIITGNVVNISNISGKQLIIVQSGEYRVTYMGNIDLSPLEVGSKVGVGKVIAKTLDSENIVVSVWRGKEKLYSQVIFDCH